MSSRLQGLGLKLRQSILLPRPNTKALLLGIMLFLFLAVVLRWAVQSYAGYAGQLQDRIQVQEVRYKNLQQLLERAEEYRQQHAELAELKQDTLQSRLIKASSPALAEARLQEMIMELAREFGLQMQSMRTLSREQAHGVLLLGLEISAQGEIQALQRFLQGISHGEKFIFFQELQAGAVNQQDERRLELNSKLTAWAKL